MRFRSVSVPRLLAVLVVSGAALSAQRQIPIENDQVRVLAVTDKPHAKNSMHEHKLNRVMVYLQPGSQDIVYQDGRKVTMTWKAGEVKWSAAGGLHTSEIISDTPVNMVEVEIKKEGDPSKTIKTPLDPPKVAPKSYHVEFENSQVRVIRVRMPAGDGVPMHEHVLNRVMIYISDQNTRMTNADGTVAAAQHKAGEASWAGPAKHKEQNVNDKPFEAVVVELKN
jgi:uncharacterized RmlC-like cupin family protein